MKYSLSDFIYDSATGVHIPPTDHKQISKLFNYSDGKKIENYILNVIKNAKDISADSDELMSKVRDWISYYHLGVGRANILRIFDTFPKNARIIEFGSGCGAITRYLGENFQSIDAIEGSFLRAQITRERCRDLKNVRVFCSNFNKIKFNSSYDIATLIGVLEYAPMFFKKSEEPRDSCLELLKLARSSLKKNGVLIIAIENKIGIKYWSGCPEDHTGEIFEGINGYPSNKGPLTFSKKEIESLLRDAGFGKSSFYYCFPDYKFASTIISDTRDQEIDSYLHNWIES